MSFEDVSLLLISCVLRHKHLLQLPVGLNLVCCSGHRWIGLVLFTIVQAPIPPS